MIVITRAELWALRYPETEGLHVLERAAGAALEHSSPKRTIHVHSDELADAPSVVIASEPMDTDPGWRSLAAGELLHADAERRVSSTVVIEHPPHHPLTLADLGPPAAAAAQTTG